MLDQTEVCKIARSLVDQYGNAAGVHAALRINEFADAGDLSRADVWRRVLDAIDSLVSGRAEQQLAQ